MEDLHVEEPESLLFEQQHSVIYTKANLPYTKCNKNPDTRNHKELCLNNVTPEERLAEADIMESSDEFMQASDMQLRKPNTYSSIQITKDINLRGKCINREDSDLCFDKMTDNERGNICNGITDDISRTLEDHCPLLEESGPDTVSSGTEININDNEKVLDKHVHSKNEDVTVKQESQVEEFTQVKRPKRKRNGTINYNENILWELGPFNDIKAARQVDYQPKQCRKLKQQKPEGRTKIIHSDSHFVDMFNNLHKLQKDGKYCDVKFCGSDGDVLAHSLVLISASPFLHKQLKQTIKKKTWGNDVTELSFKHVPKLALQKIVEFLYTGSFECAENDTNIFGKHCKALGLNELYKKLNSKLCFVESAVLSENAIPNEEKTGKASKSSNNSYSGTLEIKGEIDCLNIKSRKRKLKPGKNAEINLKLPRQSLDSDKSNTEKESKVISDETSEKEIENGTILLCSKTEEMENDKKIEENIRPEEKHSLDTDNNIDDDEWHTGDDSYIDDKTKKNRNVKRKSVKKGMEIEENKKLKKIEKHKQMKSAKKKEEVQNCSIEIAAESGNKVEENISSINSAETESHINTEESKAMLGENQGNLKLEIDSGNGGECEKCGKKFYFQYELTGHRNKCAGKNNRQRRKCVTCHVNFNSTEDYNKHRNSDVRCIKLRQEKLAKRKQRRFEMRRKYCCCACSRKFRRLADQIEHEFLAHEIQYDKEKWPDLYCEYCSYWSMNPWKLHHHKLVSCNKGQEPICDMCGNSYKNEKTLKKHKELMHTDVQPMLTCEECGKTLKGQKGLKHHIRLRHRGENLHNLMMCHICSQTYRTSSDLTFHLYKVHDQPLPEGFTVYRCPRCDYCHNNKRFFDKHMFLHEDKREWHCETCSKAFKTKNSLTTHMIVHTSERIPCPFDDCTYKALKNCHLKNHIENQHTQKGEKREKCHLCEYSTFFRGNLIKHQRSVHKLEVVTRHSVEMKARYKNLKSGQIIGVKDDTVNEKKCKSTDYTSTHPVPESRYPVSLSSDPSMVENHSHFKNKSVPSPASQNVTESFVYTLVNAPIMQHSSSYPVNANIYRIPPIDFSLYNHNTTMDQM